MRWRAVAMISLGLNLLLAAGWFVSSNPGRKVPLAQPGDGTNVLSNAFGRPNVVVRRQFFSWRELESPDYAVYVANLRDIGCPEQTIRDIIIADVNALYSRRLATELVTADQQWWRSEPDTNVMLTATQKSRELDEERRTLLAKLLGQNWETRDLGNLPRPSRPGVVLDGPVLGALSSETRDAVQEISARSEERMQAYIDAQEKAGQPLDPMALERLRQETRDALSGVLSPQALEEFLLRYSQTANNLRSYFGNLQYFNASPDEFRAVFRSVDNLDHRIAMLGNGTDANTTAARKALEDQRENALRLALGQKRYQEYRLLQDPLYRDAVATATEAGSPESARTIYMVNLAAAEELSRIQSKTNLTAQQRELELRQLELDRMRASTVVAGQELPPEPPPSTSTTQTAPQRRTYTMRPGDSLAVVALIYGVPASAIRDANPNVNFNRLRPGDSITIPRNALTPGMPNLPGMPGMQP